MTELWNTLRVPVAFLIAPLGASLIAALIFGFNALADPMGAFSILSDPGTSRVTFAFTMLPAFIAYPIMFVIGVPLYRILVKKDVTAFWVAPVAGFGIALAFCLLLALSADSLPESFVLIATLSGAAIGTIFWLIARPDRQNVTAD